MTVRIVTDSSCDLPEELAQELNIAIVPLTIRFGGEEFVDRQDLTPSQFWKRCASSPVLPETAAPAPGAFEAAFHEALSAGATGAVCITLSGALSATLQSATLAAAAMEGALTVEVVDSRSVSMGLGMMVAAAARAAAAGDSAAEIARSTRSTAQRTHVWGSLDTLENLRKGGRIGGAKALVASVLSIKPIIEVRDGTVEEGGRQRTRAKAWSFLVDKVRAQPQLEALAAMHAEVPEIDQLLDQLRSLYKGEIIVGHIGPVIGAHAGPGVVGIAFTTPA